MADDAVKDFTPPLKKARYDDDDAAAPSQTFADGTLEKSGDCPAEAPELVELGDAKKTLPRKDDEEEEERQITNGHVSITLNLIKFLIAR